MTLSERVLCAYLCEWLCDVTMTSMMGLQLGVCTSGCFGDSILDDDVAYNVGISTPLL